MSLLDFDEVESPTIQVGDKEFKVGLKANQVEAMTPQVPLRRVGQPEDAASARARPGRGGGLWVRGGGCCGCGGGGGVGGRAPWGCG